MTQDEYQRAQARAGKYTELSAAVKHYLGLPEDATVAEYEAAHDEMRRLAED